MSESVRHRTPALKPAYTWCGAMPAKNGPSQPFTPCRQVPCSSSQHRQCSPQWPIVQLFMKHAGPSIRLSLHPSKTPDGIAYSAADAERPKSMPGWVYISSSAVCTTGHLASPPQLLLLLASSGYSRRIHLQASCHQFSVIAKSTIEQA
eukprot:354903-Chlamydomonas_euryale.AAC.33